MRCILRKNHRFPAQTETRCIDASHETRRCRFDIAFYASHLTCEEQSNLSAKLQCRPQYLRRIDERIPVHDAIANKLRMFQARNHAENPTLLRPFQMCLKAHDIV